MVWKMTEGIKQIFTRALKFHKNGTLMGSLIQSRKSMSLKSTELSVMTMKNDAKFVFQNGPQEFDNFHTST